MTVTAEQIEHEARCQRCGATFDGRFGYMGALVKEPRPYCTPRCRVRAAKGIPVRRRSAMALGLLAGEKLTVHLLTVPSGTGARESACGRQGRAIVGLEDLFPPEVLDAATCRTCVKRADD